MLALLCLLCTGSILLSVLVLVRRDRRVAEMESRILAAMHQGVGTSPSPPVPAVDYLALTAMVRTAQAPPPRCVVCGYVVGGVSHQVRGGIVHAGPCQALYGGVVES